MLTFSPFQDWKASRPLVNLGQYCCLNSYRTMTETAVFRNTDPLKYKQAS